MSKRAKNILLETLAGIAALAIEIAVIALYWNYPLY